MLHMRKHVQGVIKVMSSSISGCALALVNQQQLVKKAEWIYNWMGYTTIDKIFVIWLCDLWLWYMWPLCDLCVTVMCDVTKS